MLLLLPTAPHNLSFSFICSWEKLLFFLLLSTVSWLVFLTVTIFFFFCSHSLFITSWCRFFKKNPHILFSPAPTVQSPALWVGVWMTFRWPPLSRNPQFLSQPALHRSNPSTLHWNSSNLTASCKLTVLIRRWVQFMPPRRDTNRHTKPVLTSSFSNTQINDKLGAANKNEIIILTQTSHGEVCLEKVD